MTTIEILKKARELLSDEERWAKGDYAYLSEEEGALAVNWNSPAAACWCPAGALLKSAQGQAAEALIALAFGLPAIEGVACPKKEDEAIEQIAIWNDAPERTHAEVLQHFDETIARLEAAG